MGLNCGFKRVPCKNPDCIWGGLVPVASTFVLVSSLDFLMWNTTLADERENPAEHITISITSQLHKIM